MIVLKKTEDSVTISPTLSNLIAEANFSIESAKEKILTAYHYAVDKEGLTPQEAHHILKQKLVFSQRYIREVLPLEAKHEKMIRKSTPKEEETDQEIAEHVPQLASDIIIPPEEPSELDKFRYERGHNIVVEDDEQQQIIYDSAYVERLEKENYQLKQIFSAPITCEIKGQDLPLIIKVDPENKKILNAELDKVRAKQLVR